MADIPRESASGRWTLLVVFSLDVNGPKVRWTQLIRSILGLSIELAAQHTNGPDICHGLYIRDYGCTILPAGYNWVRLGRPPSSRLLQFLEKWAITRPKHLLVWPKQVTGLTAAFLIAPVRAGPTGLSGRSGHFASQNVPSFAKSDYLSLILSGTF